MTPEQTQILISAVGGVRKFSIRLGLGEDDLTLRRVSNWRKRGVPAFVQLTKRRELNHIAHLAEKRGFLL